MNEKGVSILFRGGWVAQQDNQGKHWFEKMTFQSSFEVVGLRNLGNTDEVVIQRCVSILFRGGWVAQQWAASIKF